MGKNTVVIFRHDDLDAIEANPDQAIAGISQAIVGGGRFDASRHLGSSVTIRDGSLVHDNAISVMPSIDSKDVVMYLAMNNGLVPVTLKNLQNSRTLLENLLNYLREHLDMRIPKDPF